jgi:hypothetical protein
MLHCTLLDIRYAYNSLLTVRLKPLFGATAFCFIIPKSRIPGNECKNGSAVFLIDFDPGGEPGMLVSSVLLEKVEDQITEHNQVAHDPGIAGPGLVFA